MVADAVDKSKHGTTSMRSKDGRAADQRSGARSDGGGPPASDTYSVLCTMPAVTCFVSAKDNFASPIPVTFTSLIVMSSNACNVNNI